MIWTPIEGAAGHFRSIRPEDTGDDTPGLPTGEALASLREAVRD